MQAAVALGAAVVERPAEVPKGSPTSLRPTAPPGRGRRERTVLCRRALRLHRAALEERRMAGGRGAVPLSSRQRAKWRVLLEEGHVQRITEDQADAIELASKLAAAEDAKVAKRMAKEWRQRFAGGASASALQAAGQALKAQPATGSGTTAADMRNTWREWWRPEGGEPGGVYADRWRQSAADLHVAAEEQKQWARPSPELFAQLLRTPKRSAGLDGWSGHELAGLAKHLSRVVEMLHGILVRAVEAEPTVHQGEHDEDSEERPACGRESGRHPEEGIRGEEAHRCDEHHVACVSEVHVAFDWGAVCRAVRQQARRVGGDGHG